MSSYNPSHAGIAEFLQSQMMQDMVREVGQKIMDRAIAAAPVGDPVVDEHPGRYVASFHLRVHARGGATNDRAEAVVSNSSPEAEYVEFGHRGREPYHTLLRAANEVRFIL